MDSNKSSSEVWMVMFILTLIVAIGLLVGFLHDRSQLSSVTAKYNQQTSSNTESLKQCLNVAQNTFNTGGDGIGSSASTALDSSVNACKSEYPSN